MSVPRRKFLQVLSYAFGSGLVAQGNGFAATGKESGQTAGGGAGVKAQQESMEKVAGIGGLFFRARDPEALGQWYLQHLGIALTPTTEDAAVWQQEAGPTVFTPFPEKTGYFGDPAKMWMVNFRVHHLDRMVAQLRAAGIEVKVDPQAYPNGRFAHLRDPEGNPIELWQPA